MKILDILSSVKLFIALSVLVLAAFLAGGIFPQGLPPQAYQEMFGRIGSGWITRSGLNDVFSSAWFLALMACAALNLAACTVKQWRTIKLRPGVFLTHLAVILIFAGGAVRGVARVGGILPMQVGETHSEFTTAAGKPAPLPFEVTLKDFQIIYRESGEKHFLHAVRGEMAHGDTQVLETVEVREGKPAEFKTVPVNVMVMKFYPNFSIGESGPFSAGEARANPALAIVSRTGKTPKPQYLFSLYPDYHGAQDKSGIRLIYEHQGGGIKQFESVIAISEGGAVKLEKKISVNSPAYYRGYRLYQSGYDERNLKFSSIQVSKDPSVYIIYSGFALLMLGLTMAFWKEVKK